MCRSDTDDENDEPRLGPVIEMISQGDVVERGEVDTGMSRGKESEMPSVSNEDVSKIRVDAPIEDEESGAGVIEATGPQTPGPSRVPDVEIVDVDAEDDQQDDWSEDSAATDVSKGGRGRGKAKRGPSKRRRRDAPPSRNLKGKGRARDLDEKSEDQQIEEDHPVFGRLFHSSFKADVIHRTMPDQVFNVKRLPSPGSASAHGSTRDVSSSVLI